MVIYFIILLTIIMFAVCSNVIDFGNETITENLTEGGHIEKCPSGWELGSDNVCRSEYQGPRPRALGDEAPQSPVCGEPVSSCHGWTCTASDNLKYFPPNVGGSDSGSGYCCVNGTWVAGKCEPYCAGGARAKTGRSGGIGGCTRQFPYPAYGGKICYNKKAYANARSGPCDSWCTNDRTFGSGCGDPAKKLCYPSSLAGARRQSSGGGGGGGGRGGGARQPGANAYCSATNTNSSLWCAQKACLLPGFRGSALGRQKCPAARMVGGINVPPLPPLGAMVPTIVSGVDNNCSADGICEN